MSAADLPVQERVVLISGANRGIGRAIAERLARRGYRLSLGARDPHSLAAVSAAMDGAQVMGCAYEARSPDSAGDWVQATVQRFGRIDAVVNNAAVFRRFRVEDGEEADLDLMWEVNLKGPLRLFRAAFPHLKASGQGRVVNIASLSGKRIKSAAAAGYAISKHALVAFTHAVRMSGWEHGIRCSAICPGYVNTEMARNLFDVDPARMTQPQEVAAVVELLLSLPNTASVAEVPVNSVLEPGF